MSKIIRKTASIFASSAGVNQLEQFGAKEVTGNYNGQSPPADPAVIQSLSAWKGGWSSAQYEVFAPYLQDRNAVDYVNSYQIAYLLQMGVPEWDSETTYYTNSIVQYNGQKFISLADNNIGNTPPNIASNATWQIISFPSTIQLKAPTLTILNSGSGDYYPPDGCIRLRVRAVGGGGGGWGSGDSGSAGGNTTFQTSGGTYLIAAGGGGLKEDINGNVYPVGGTANYTGNARSDINVNGCVSENYVGFGGDSILGCGGGKGTVNLQPTGNGSGGGVETSTTPYGGGYGGASGAYCEVSDVYVSYQGPGLTNPYPFSYAVGAGGAGGGGTYPGQNGTAGIIIIDEFYY